MSTYMVNWNNVLQVGDTFYDACADVTLDPSLAAGLPPDVLLLQGDGVSAPVSVVEPVVPEPVVEAGPVVEEDPKPTRSLGSKP